LNSKTCYKKAFFNILLRRVRILLQSFPIVLKGTPNKYFLNQSKWVPKTQNFMLISDLLENFFLNAYEKIYEQNSQLKVHFLGFYLNIVLVICI